MQCQLFSYPVHSPVCVELLLTFLVFLGSSEELSRWNCVQSNDPWTHTAVELQPNQNLKCKHYILTRKNGSLFYINWQHDHNTQKLCVFWLYKNFRIFSQHQPQPSPEAIPPRSAFLQKPAALLPFQIFSNLRRQSQYSKYHKLWPPSSRRHFESRSSLLSWSVDLSIRSNQLI